MDIIIRLFRRGNPEPELLPSVVDSDYTTLQQKARTYGIRANLSKKDLERDISLIEKGKGHKVPPHHVLKNNTNFFLLHRKKIAISGTALLILILVTILILKSL